MQKKKLNTTASLAFLHLSYEIPCMDVFLQFSVHECARNQNEQDVSDTGFPYSMTILNQLWHLTISQK